MAIRSIVPQHEQNKARLARAKSLIHRKRYGDARRLLETIDHPIAKQWLHQLDSLELGNPFQPSSVQKWRKVIVRTLLVITLLVLVVIMKLQYDRANEVQQQIWYGGLVLLCGWL